MTIDDDSELRKILCGAKCIAVVGASQKPWRDSHTIMQYLLAKGFDVVPVNPAYDTVLGLTCLPDLLSVKRPIDIVDIFRNPDDLIPVISDSIAVKAKVVWMQSGIINHKAAEMASAAGIAVVMDRCIAVDHSRLCHAA